MLGADRSTWRDCYRRFAGSGCRSGAEEVAAGTASRTIVGPRLPTRGTPAVGTYGRGRSDDTRLALLHPFIVLLLLSARIASPGRECTDEPGDPAEEPQDEKPPPAIDRCLVGAPDEEGVDRESDQQHENFHVTTVATGGGGEGSARDRLPGRQVGRDPPFDHNSPARGWCGDTNQISRRGVRRCHRHGRGRSRKTTGLVTIVGPTIVSNIQGNPAVSVRPVRNAAHPSGNCGTDGSARSCSSRVTAPAHRRPRAQRRCWSPAPSRAPRPTGRRS